MKDILRAALCVPALKVADVSANAAEIERRITEAHEQGAALIAFPELAITGYTCGDLFASELLIERVEEALCRIAATTPADLLVLVGAPLLIKGQLYNCAVAMAGGSIVGAVPKAFLPDYGEYSERRRFTPAASLAPTLQTLGCFTFPVSSDLLFRAADGTTVGVEICEDLLAPLPPSTLLALNGAEVLVNLSAGNESVGKRTYRRDTVVGQSARTISAYLYVSAGADESTADMVFSGHSLAALNGEALCENEKLIDRDYLLMTDLDLGRIRYDRRHNRTFGECATEFGGLLDPETVDLPFAMATADGAHLTLSHLPFIPSERNARIARCNEIYTMQAEALARRLSITGGKLTVGISGGLDSTLALLVAIRAMEILQLPRTNIIAITMPCFGTTDKTLQNSLVLMERLGVTSRTIPIKDAVLRHFRDIGQSPDDYSVTYENAQARERTQVLMDVANKENAIVLGTGDLSELALGWCTYNGDHMSMYGVNGGVPKTLVRWVIASIAEQDLLPEATEVLLRVLDTPISPELLPPDAMGKIAQKTEDIVGPYALHDFFLYWAVRYQYRPAKIFALARRAFEGMFDGATIQKWLRVFWRRFFGQQFKRNCLPDGVKIGSVGLSPRGDWQMPSDGSAAEWLREIDELEIE